jgi:hypothetical protein
MGHILTSDEYNPTGICPECRPQEFKTTREQYKKLTFATRYGMSPVHFAAQEQLSEIQAREMLKQFEQTQVKYSKILKKTGNVLGAGYQTCYNGPFSGSFTLKSDPSLPEYAFRFEEAESQDEEEDLLHLERIDAPWWFE